MIYTNFKELKPVEREFDFGKIYQIPFGAKGKNNVFTSMTCPKDAVLNNGFNEKYSIGMTKSGKLRIVDAKENDNRMAMIIIDDEYFVDKKNSHDPVHIAVTDAGVVTTGIIGKKVYKFNKFNDVLKRTVEETAECNVVLVEFTGDADMMVQLTVGDKVETFSINRADNTMVSVDNADIPSDVTFKLIH